MGYNERVIRFKDFHNGFPVRFSPNMYDSNSDILKDVLDKINKASRALLPKKSKKRYTKRNILLLSNGWLSDVLKELRRMYFDNISNGLK